MEQWEKDWPYIVEHYKKHGIDITEDDDDLPEDGVLYFVTVDGLKDSRTLSGPEKKYGVNEWHNLELCPRCVDAVPVKVRDIPQGTALHCKKCIHCGHKDGSLIRVIPNE